MSVEATGNIAPVITQSAQAEAQQVRQSQQAMQKRETPVEATRETLETIEASVEKMQKAAEQLNQFMKNGQRSLDFSVDKNTNQVVVQVVDKSTKEIVRQIPGPEAIKLAENLEQMMGVIFSRTI